MKLFMDFFVFMVAMILFMDAYPFQGFWNIFFVMEIIFEVKVICLLRKRTEVMFSFCFVDFVLHFGVWVIILNLLPWFPNPENSL